MGIRAYFGSKWYFCFGFCKVNYDVTNFALVCIEKINCVNLHHNYNEFVIFGFSGSGTLSFVTNSIIFAAWLDKSKLSMASNSAHKKAVKKVGI